MMKKIVAVTGCPTGIAHTYMAKEALEVAAKKLGVEIKVETNGAVGTENELTPKDIADAIGVIVASDKNTDMDRFNGKPVIETSVSDGINKAEKLIQACLDGEVTVRGGSVKQTGTLVSNESFGHAIYKHLMNGVSHMLPLVVAGGILVAISFLWGIHSANPESDQYNQIAYWINQVGGAAMGLMVPVFTGYIAQSIAGRPAMLTGFVAGTLAVATGSGFIGGIAGGFAIGYFVKWLIQLLKPMPRSLEGLKSIFLIPLISTFVIGMIMVISGGPVSDLNNAMMNVLKDLQNSNPALLGIVIGCMSAFDMGGPVNKAAYVTGTMLLGEGNYYFMAGVSAACITPPLVIAIAATLFKDRFTPEDRTAGFVNYILGCTHITEGAIPFAAKNPLKVLPVLMIASSISAVLTYLMKIQVPAPHGGFLILYLVNEPLLWVGCILVGSLVGAVLYRFVTPKATIEDERIETESKSTDPEMFNEKTVNLNLQAKTKEEAIIEMIDLLAADNVVTDKKQFKDAIYEREELSTTAIGNGIAIPHARSKAVTNPRVGVAISKDGFDFGSVDGNPCHLLFMIATGESDNNMHLQTLASLSTKLMHQDFVNALLQAKSAKEVVRILYEK